MRVFVYGFGFDVCLFFRVLRGLNSGVLVSPLLRFLGFVPESFDVVGFGGVEFCDLGSFLSERCGGDFSDFGGVRCFDVSSLPVGDVALVFCPGDFARLSGVVRGFLDSGFNVVDFSGFSFSLYDGLVRYAEERGRVFLGGFLVGYFDVFVFAKVFSDFLRFLGFGDFEGFVSVFSSFGEFARFPGSFDVFKVVNVFKRVRKGFGLSSFKIFDERFSFSFDVLGSFDLSRILMLIDLAFGAFFANRSGLSGLVDFLFNVGFLEGVERSGNYFNAISTFFNFVKNVVGK